MDSEIEGRLNIAAVERAVEVFDLAAASGDPDRQADAAMAVLETAAALVEAESWFWLLRSGRLSELESSFTAPLVLLAALEQESFAPPETGLVGWATGRIEAIGHAHANDDAVAREAERLLHAAGEAAAAYRVERSRRAVRRRPNVRDGQREGRQALSLVGLKLALIGGYPALRASIARDLERAHIEEVREIPPAREGSRIERDVQATLNGVDFAVVLIRHVGHSTSDQVKRVAERSGIPVVVVDSAGSSGVRRAIERFIARQRTP
jgi:hypothetical protein